MFQLCHPILRNAWLMSAYLALKERKIVYSDIRTLLGIQNLQLDLTDIAVLVSAAYTVKNAVFL